METNKQQSPLKVLINGLISRRENIIKNSGNMTQDMLEGGVMAFESAIDLAQSLLETEKSNMIGLLQWMNKISLETPMRLETDDDDIVEQYYNETYGGKQ